MNEHRTSDPLCRSVFQTPFSHQFKSGVHLAPATGRKISVRMTPYTRPVTSHALSETRPEHLAVRPLRLIAAGVFNLCPVAPLWGGHFFGSQYCPAKKTKGSD